MQSRRVKTSVMKKAKNSGIRGDGFNYRLLKGPAIWLFSDAELQDAR